MLGVCCNLKCSEKKKVQYKTFCCKRKVSIVTSPRKIQNKILLTHTITTCQSKLSLSPKESWHENLFLWTVHISLYSFISRLLVWNALRIISGCESAKVMGTRGKLNETSECTFTPVIYQHWHNMYSEFCATDISNIQIYFTRTIVEMPKNRNNNNHKIKMTMTIMIKLQPINTHGTNLRDAIANGQPNGWNSGNANEEDTPSFMWMWSCCSDNILYYILVYIPQTVDN